MTEDTTTVSTEGAITVSTEDAITVSTEDATIVSTEDATTASTEVLEFHIKELISKATGCSVQLSEENSITHKQYEQLQSQYYSVIHDLRYYQKKARKEEQRAIY